MATWYGEGTVSVANGSATVAGVGTAFVANVKIGEEFRLLGGAGYEVAAVVSNTELTLAREYAGTSQSGQAYEIVPVRGVLKSAYDALTSAIATMQGYIDTALSGLFGDGSVGAAGIGFTADPDTGFYRPGANELAITVGGSRRMQLQNTSSLVQFWPNGTARTFWLDHNSVRADAPIYVQATGAFQAADGVSTESKAAIHINAATAAGGGAEGLLGGMVTFSRASGVSGRRKAAIGAVQIGADEDSTGLAFLTYSGGTTSTDQVNTRGVVFGNDFLMRGDLYANTDVETWPVVRGDRVLHEGDIQDDPLDTANDLMKVGAFGLGGTNLAAVQVDDGRADLPSGFYSGTGSNGLEADWFNSGHRFAPFLNLNRRSGNNYSSSRMFFEGGKIPWVAFRDTTGIWEARANMLYGTENILGPVADDGTKPTGGVIERGSNANGVYTRFADGLQICTAVIDIDTTTDVRQDWPMPAGFGSAYPTVCGISLLRDDLSGAGYTGRIDAVLATAMGGSNTTWSMRFNSPPNLGDVTVTVRAFAIGHTSAP